MKARKLLTNWHFKIDTCECCGQETEKEWTTRSYFVRASRDVCFLKAPLAKYNPVGWLCLIKSHYKDGVATLLFRNNPMLSNAIKWGGGNEPKL